MLRLRDGELQTLGFMEKISRKKMKNRERERERRVSILGQMGQNPVFKTARLDNKQDADTCQNLG